MCGLPGGGVVELSTGGSTPPFIHCNSSPVEVFADAAMMSGYDSGHANRKNNDSDIFEFEFLGFSIPFRRIPMVRHFGFQFKFK